MTDVKQIMMQGANIERVDNPFVVSTGRALTKAELRSRGVDVDGIAKYADLPETAHVFSTFSGDLDLNVCKLSIRVYLADESLDDDDIIQDFNVDITSVTVGGLIEEIQTSLDLNNNLVDFLVELRNNRVQITARRAQSHIRVDALHILDSRGAASAESVNDLSNPERLFTYFSPDARAISRLGDPSPTPARGEFVTAQSVGVSQGEPRTSASLNRGLMKHSGIIDKASLLSGINSAAPRTVRIPLDVTGGAIDLTVDYTSSFDTPPKAVWSSTYVPGQAAPQPEEPHPRLGGVYGVDLPNSVSVLALRGISIPPRSTPFTSAKIVNAEGTPLGLISPDSRLRGSTLRPDRTDLDYGVPFITQASRWRVIKSNATVSDHPLVEDPTPWSTYFAWPDDPLIDESQFEILGEEAEFATGFTRIDEVTLELEAPAPYRYKWARVRLSGSQRSFIVREWINERRVIISEIPDELQNSSYYPSGADLDDLNDPAVNTLFISRGMISMPQEWFYISVLGTSGPLAWINSEDLYLEIDVADPPASVNDGAEVIMDVRSSTSLASNNAEVRSASPTARRLEDRGEYTLKGAYESALGGMTLRHSVGGPYDTETFNELLTRAHARLVNGPHTRIVSDAPGGITLQRFNDLNPTLVYEQAGQNITVDLSEATATTLSEDYADGIDEFLDDKFAVKRGDTRYRILRAITLRYASGTLSRRVTIHPETFSLTIELGVGPTGLLEGTGFLEEHVGLSLLVTDYGVTPLLIMITSVETTRSAKFKFLDVSGVFSGMSSAVVELKLAPYHLVNGVSMRGESPSIIILGLRTLGAAERVATPAAIEIEGERPLESYSSLGDWMAQITPENRRTFRVIEYDNVKYAQVPLTQGAEPLSVRDLPSRLKVRESSRVTSLGGRIWRASGLSHPGDFPDFLLIGQPSTAGGHAVEFYLKVVAQGSSSSLVYPPFKVESLDVITVIQDQGVENYIYGLLIPVPDYALTRVTVRGDETDVLIAGNIETLKKRVSLNKTEAYIDNAYLDNPSALDTLNIYASTDATSPSLEVTVYRDYDEGTPRPSGTMGSRSENTSEFGGRRASSRIEARHEYQDRDDADDNVVIVSEMSLSGGQGEIGLTAGHRYTQERDEYLTLVTAYGGDESASVMKDGLYVTDPEARCEDVPDQELTGFDHEHLSGDVAVNTANVKRLSEELDAMKQREFGMLRQLSLLSAAAHESLDMLRTANATIKSLRDVQYELSMTLLGVLDMRSNDFHFDNDNNSIRDFLVLRSGAALQQNLPHRLIKALHLAGHAVMTDLPYSNAPVLGDLSTYFEGTSHTSASSHALSPTPEGGVTSRFEDDIPLKYERPGYSRVRTTDGFAIDQHEALDPISQILRPTTLLNAGSYYPLYVRATHEDREGTSRENVSWTSALNEKRAIIQEARDMAVSDFDGLVSYTSPLFSFRPRADSTVGADVAPNAVCMYLMGVGYWSPSSIGHAREGTYLESKARPDASGWFFTTTSTRRVGPEQVSVTDNMLEYGRLNDLTFDDGTGPVTYRGYGALSRLTAISGHNAMLYSDPYILSKIEEGRDLIVGVARSPITNNNWTVYRATLLGYPYLFQNSSFVAPAADTRNYLTLDEAKDGHHLFYTIEEDSHPLPVVPGLYIDDTGSLSPNPPIHMPTSYDNSSTITGLYGPAPDTLDDFKIVYCRAWCVARADSEDELWQDLYAIGFFSRDDIRVSAKELADGTWAGIRTRLGMAEFIKELNYGHYAAPGQVRFSFNEVEGGKYLNSAQAVKTSQDPT